MSEQSASFQSLLTYIPELSAPVALQHLQIPEVETVSGLEEAMNEYSAGRLITCIVRAGSLTQHADKVLNHRALASMAAERLTSAGHPHKVKEEVRKNVTARVARGHGNIHFDEPDHSSGIASRINVHQVVAGQSRVLLAKSGPLLPELQAREIQERWEPSVFQVLGATILGGETIPDVMSPDVYVADLYSGDVLFFAERNLPLTGEAVWHRFDTTQTPRESFSMWIEPSVLLEDGKNKDSL
ncbi:MAG TPA: hypothetical protein VLG16_03595 [Candidatus Saccharimonadales bacterium]|nr:hypothetical protein [Candidatus Saccharimonadales bacterium]